MYEGTYAPWENTPKYLKHHEIANPLDVIAYFFEIDSVTGHAKRFKEWRDYAVRSEYYVNVRSGPGALLYTWEEHVRLVEAMYLVWHQHRNSWGFRPASDEQLAEEKETWDYYPAKLNAKQLANPYAVAKRFFKSTSLAVYRDHLFEWLDMALTRSENRDPVIDAEDVINVYENMLELYDAAWIIRQRYVKEPHLKRDNSPSLTPVKTTDAEEAGFSKDKADTEMSQSPNPGSYLLRPLYPHPTPAEKLGLQKIKDIILDLIIQKLTFYKDVQIYNRIQDGLSLDPKSYNHIDISEENTKVILPGNYLDVFSNQLDKKADEAELREFRKQLAILKLKVEGRDIYNNKVVVEKGFKWFVRHG